MLPNADLQLIVAYVTVHFMTGRQEGRRQGNTTTNGLGVEGHMMLGLFLLHWFRFLLH